MGGSKNDRLIFYHSYRKFFPCPPPPVNYGFLILCRFNWQSANNILTKKCVKCVIMSCYNLMYNNLFCSKTLHVYMFANSFWMIHTFWPNIGNHSPVWWQTFQKRESLSRIRQKKSLALPPGVYTKYFHDNKLGFCLSLGRLLRIDFTGLL